MGKDEDLDKLLENLPLFIKEQINKHPDKERIVEIIMDLGRRPEARFTTGPQILSQKMVSWQNETYEMTFEEDNISRSSMRDNLKIRDKADNILNRLEYEVY